ncbi:MAG TPA: DUF4926 domain-containing protein [Clostridiales bacterium]|nr:DUF4926 domain-containing protein [Clostridiales bacterium]
MGSTTGGAIGTHTVTGSSISTIITSYNTISVQYEVEFVDNDGNTIEVLTVSENDIESINDI